MLQAKILKQDPREMMGAAKEQSRPGESGEQTAGRIIRESRGRREPGKAAEKKSKGAAMSGFTALYRKELTDHFSGVRVFLIFCLMFIVTAMSLNGAIGNLSDAIADSKEYVFLKLFTTSGDSIYSFTTFLGFFGPIIGIALGFDAVNNEKSQGTLIRIASQPIYRDVIINAKFLAGCTVIFILTFVLGGFETGVGIIKTGLRPGPEEFGRIFIYLLFSAVYCCVWLAMSVFFSVICKHAATAAISGISIWLFLTMFMSLAAQGIANAIYPLTGWGAYYNQYKNYSLQIGLNRISPYYLYSEAVSIIMDPSSRSVGLVTESQYSGAVVSYLSIGQSVLLIWPHLVAMFAIAVVLFAIAYICFMKQEIRA